MGNERLLVVDDEADLREILQFNLQHEGYIVDTAESAEEALSILTPEHQLILLDVMMQGMSGFKMSEKLRKEMKVETPIIFLTAKETENDLLTGFSVGGDDYITKPFSLKEVIARVKVVLKRAISVEKHSESKINIGPLEITPEQKMVQLNGISLILTKKEFEILILLAQSLGRFYTRQEILVRVWPDDVYVLDRTVDVHINRLRRKLGDYSDMIVSRSGYGYCLEEKI